MQLRNLSHYVKCSRWDGHETGRCRANPWYQSLVARLYASCSLGRLALTHTLFPVSSTTGWASTRVRTWSIGTATRVKAIIRAVEALVDVVAR
jgi:hypothetical protein